MSLTVLIIRRNIDRYGGKEIICPPTFEDLLRIASNKLRISAKRIVHEEGHEIETVDVLSAGDVLYVLKEDEEYIPTPIDPLLSLLDFNTRPMISSFWTLRERETRRELVKISMGKMEYYTTRTVDFLQWE